MCYIHPSDKCLAKLQLSKISTRKSATDIFIYFKDDPCVVIVFVSVRAILLKRIYSQSILLEFLFVYISCLRLSEKWRKNINMRRSESPAFDPVFGCRIVRAWCVEAVVGRRELRARAFAIKPCVRMSDYRRSCLQRRGAETMRLFHCFCSVWFRSATDNPSQRGSYRTPLFFFRSHRRFNAYF